MRFFQTKHSMLYKQNSTVIFITVGFFHVVAAVIIQLFFCISENPCRIPHFQYKQSTDTRNQKTARNHCNYSGRVFPYCNPVTLPVADKI